MILIFMNVSECMAIVSRCSSMCSLANGILFTFPKPHHIYTLCDSQVREWYYLFIRNDF